MIEHSKNSALATLNKTSANKIKSSKAVTYPTGTEFKEKTAGLQSSMSSRSQVHPLEFLILSGAKDQTHL